jgi:hypothetical protein
MPGYGAYRHHPVLSRTHTDAADSCANKSDKKDPLKVRALLRISEVLSTQRSLKNKIPRELRSWPNKAPPKAPALDV